MYALLVQNYHKITRQYVILHTSESQLHVPNWMFTFFTILDQDVQHLQGIVYWCLSINIWFSGISAMHNKEFNLKSLSSISSNMKWGVTSILGRQGRVSWS